MRVVRPAMPRVGAGGGRKLLSPLSPRGATLAAVFRLHWPHSGVQSVYSCTTVVQWPHSGVQLGVLGATVSRNLPE